MERYNEERRAHGKGRIGFAKGCKDTNRNSIEIYRQCKCGFWIIVVVFILLSWYFDVCLIIVILRYIIIKKHENFTKS
jgi:hypothetical protein